MKKPFKCPVCEGEGTRAAPFNGSSTEKFEIFTPCTACSGKGIVWGGDLEQQIVDSKISYIPNNRLFGKNYLIDCARICNFPDNETIVTSFIEEISKVIQIKKDKNFPEDTSINFTEDQNEYSYFSDSSKTSYICARWNRKYLDFYLDVFSSASFDEHLIREIIIRFFEPDMYDDYIIVRRAISGYGKKFLK